NDHPHLLHERQQPFLRRVHRQQQRQHQLLRRHAHRDRILLLLLSLDCGSLLHGGSLGPWGLKVLAALILRRGRSRRYFTNSTASGTSPCLASALSIHSPGRKTLAWPICFAFGRRWTRTPERTQEGSPRRDQSSTGGAIRPCRRRAHRSASTPPALAQTGARDRRSRRHVPRPLGRDAGSPKRDRSRLRS